MMVSVHAIIWPNQRKIIAADTAAEETELPAGWRIAEPEDLIPADQLRRRFLEYLDDFPSAVCGDGTNLDDRLTVDGRYSLWWTSVGAGPVSSTRRASIAMESPCRA